MRRSSHHVWAWQHPKAVLASRSLPRAQRNNRETFKHDRAIIGKQVITPVDIERIAGITGGNIFHGELLLHQLFFMRPSAKWSGFRTPINGYYLAGSGAHPGGGIMGAPGKFAAELALKDGI